MAPLRNLFFWEGYIYAEISHFHRVLLRIQLFLDVTACRQASVSSRYEGEVSSHGHETLAQSHSVISQ